MMKVYDEIKKTMDEMTDKAIDKSCFVEYDRGYREGVMETLKVLVKNTSGNVSDDEI